MQIWKTCQPGWSPKPKWTPWRWAGRLRVIHWSGRRECVTGCSGLAAPGNPVVVLLDHRVFSPWHERRCQQERSIWASCHRAGNSQACKTTLSAQVTKVPGMRRPNRAWPIGPRWSPLHQEAQDRLLAQFVQFGSSRVDDTPSHRILKGEWHALTLPKWASDGPLLPDHCCKLAVFKNSARWTEIRTHKIAIFAHKERTEA
jgi:hypothetical protein